MRNNVVRTFGLSMIACNKYVTYFLLLSTCLAYHLCFYFENFDVTPCDDSMVFNSPTTDNKVTKLYTSLLEDIWMKQVFTHAGDGNQTATERRKTPLYLANFYTGENEVEEGDVVLVTHASTSKMPRLVIQLEYWNGPASVSIYISSRDDIFTFEKSFAAYWNTTFSKTSFHLLLEPSNEGGYPHNWLRNLALDNSPSDYFVALDVDFIPSKDAHNGLRELMQRNKTFVDKLRNRQLFVLAAFEIKRASDSMEALPFQLPKNRMHLAGMCRVRRAEPFQTRKNNGHRPTRYSLWFRQTKSSDYYNINYETNFEPYVMGYKPGIPRYWNGIRGYGFNKVSWFMELNKAGYTFGVLRNFYVCHLEHKSTFDSDSKTRNRAKQPAFEKYLEERYWVPIAKKTS